MSRIGIFSGSFDPVHAGHIAFALQAIEAAKLDMVYFAPEARPRVNNAALRGGITHVAHRIAIMELATKAHQKLRALELPDKQFTVAKTLPRLHKLFRGDELFFLCGSDMLEHMPEWKLVDRLLANVGLIVGVRDSHSVAKTEQLLTRLVAVSAEPIIIVSQKPAISARHIRDAIARHKPAEGLLSSTREYIDKNWLYSSVPESLISPRSIS